MSSLPERSRSQPKKILIVTRNLPPLVGGMERLNWHMADELSKYAEVHLIGPREAEKLKPDKVEFSGVPLRPLWRFLLQAGWLAIRYANYWKPDVVLAGSGLTAPLALFAARLCGAKAVAYVHGLDIAVAHPVYRALWLPVIRWLDRVIANSTPTAELARQAGVRKDRIGIVYPGVKLPGQLQPREVIECFLEENQLKGKKILLSVGRLTTRKGLHEFVQLALPTIVAEEPDTTLVVIGDVPSDSLHAKVQTPQKIQNVADAMGIGKHLRFLGVVDADKLATAYQAASVHIFPIRYVPNDPEGFGMVSIEAAAYGLPTVAFATGGVIDAVSERKSGRLIKTGDYPAFANATLELLRTSMESRSDCLEHSKKFSWEKFGKSMESELAS